MIAVDQSQVEAEINNFINYISPTNRSNDKRHQVVAFIRDILHKSSILEGFVIECGSSSLKSYLPESDLDLVLLAPCGKNSREEMQCLTAIFNSWCDEIADKEEGKSTHYDMTIRNVEFVNARTKLAHCLVNNISVDITVNQIGSLLTLTFLEEADRLVGMDHLFKNSLLLIKVRMKNNFVFKYFFTLNISRARINFCFFNLEPHSHRIGATTRALTTAGCRLSAPRTACCRRTPSV